MFRVFQHHFTKSAAHVWFPEIRKSTGKAICRLCGAKTPIDSEVVYLRANAQAAGVFHKECLLKLASLTVENGVPDVIRNKIHQEFLARNKHTRHRASVFINMMKPVMSGFTFKMRQSGRSVEVSGLVYTVQSEYKMRQTLVRLVDDQSIVIDSERHTARHRLSYTDPEFVRKADRYIREFMGT